MPSDAPTSTSVQQSIDGYFSGLSALDVEAVVAVFTEDCVDHDPQGTPPHQGQDGVRAFFTGMLGAVATLRMTAEQVYPCGDGAAVRWTGHYEGRNGSSGDMEGVDVMTFAPDGRISELHGYWDAGPVIAALRG